MANDKPDLPRNRAFVIQLHADAQVELGQFSGRVEHVYSYEATHFRSLDELLAFMARVLAAQEEAAEPS